MNGNLELRDFTENGLTIFTKAVNFRYTPLNLHREDGTVEFVRKYPVPRDPSKEVIELRVDLYPTLAEDDPFVLRKKNKFGERRIIHTPLPQTFELSGPANVTQGTSLTIDLTTGNVPEDAEIPYIITGIALNQTTGLPSLTGSFVIDGSGEASLTFTVKITAPIDVIRLALVETGEFIDIQIELD